MTIAQVSPKSDIRIGISGWRYEPWRGVFYPKKMPQRLELDFASRAMSSIEINGTFYALQKPASFAQWFEQTPDDFMFSVKAPKYITHVRRLKDVHQPIANFFASGVLLLRQKLGPVLWQFPPSFRFDEALMEAFLKDLPHDTEAALKLARQRDDFMAERDDLHIDQKRPLRHAIEIRHDSFKDPAFIKLLRRHKVALVVADTAGKWPYLEDVTADFMYLRLHGEEELYASGYTDDALNRWATRIAAWSRGSQPDDAHLVDGAPPKRAHRDIHCYFDNDIKVRAPFDAATLKGKLGLPTRLNPSQPDMFDVTLP
ncbi:MAG: DUF72 domain-containing protein [Rubrivivax sp.]|nr:MAG: DUF72 domain-containing protein [Rubrivivax sp.]